jgi:succinate dehydrogenase / fumarate reductase cytochrome b subunit
METAKPIERPVPRPSRLAAVWASPIGRKALMAVTGVVLFAYVLVHMLANLQIYEGPAQINRYAELLRVSPPLLWSVRVVLLASFLVHAIAGIQLALERRRARPVAYGTWAAAGSTPASRTMIWSGLLILLFVLYHLLDLTLGPANPDFVAGDVYHNVVASLGRALASLAYLVAMLALAFHLWHGLWSMFQSLGTSSAGAAGGIRRAAALFATLVALGFASIPIAVLVGLVG